MASNAYNFSSEEPSNHPHIMPSARTDAPDADLTLTHDETVDGQPTYSWELAQAFNDASRRDAELGVFHPVLLFGTAQSGKSLALASLLSYPLQSRDSEISNISHTLIDFEYPNSHPARREAKDWAREFYHREVATFQQNPFNKVLPTRREYPFFVPIRAVFGPRAEKPEIARFAFLESIGEWLDLQADGYTFGELRPDIVEILRNYSNPLSVIFVVPATYDNLLDETKVKRSHQCIAHCMNRYVGLRKRNYSDNLLLLASRWDAKYPPDAAATSDEVNNFANATSDAVIHALDSYPQAWSTFSNLPFVSEESRALMQYAPTWIIDGVRTNEGSFRPVFSRLNRTLWNWLYGNVFVDASERKRGGRGQRRNFYPDVALGNRGHSGEIYEAAMRSIVSLVPT